MNAAGSRVPHFLRVARALAGVRSVALPLAITTVAVGTYTGCADGTDVMGSAFSTGSGGAASSSSSGYGGRENGLTSMDAGYDGAATGKTAMPDAGADGG
jgi:hypothetical protein